MKIFVATTILLFILSSLLFYCYRISPKIETLAPRSSVYLYENVPQTSSTNERLTFERWSICNVNSQEPCYRTNKSLILSFWSEKSRTNWIPMNILSAFPAHSFDHIIFVYDNSSWNSHPNYDQFIFIHVKGQLRFWFVKRFLLPSMIMSYKYIWIADDDSKLNFNPLQYECVIKRLDISLSSPSRLTGALSHRITGQDEAYINKIGRWTDFIETGPTFVASSSAWLCIFKHLDASTGSGWGLDIVWCNIIADRCFPLKNRENVCAILDAFTIDHQSSRTNSGSYGAPEWPLYRKRYRELQAKSKNFRPLANNRSIIDSCTGF